MSQAFLCLQNADGSWSPAQSERATTWAYAAVAGGITNTSEVEIAAAPGAEKRHVITGLQWANKSALISTELVLKSGSTVIFRGFAPADGAACEAAFGGGAIRCGVNEAIKIACVTTGAATLVNVQGYIA